MLGALPLRSPVSANTGYVPRGRPSVMADDGSTRTPPPTTGLTGPEAGTDQRTLGSATPQPPPRPAPTPPVRLELPGMRLSAPVIPVAVAAGALTVPEDPDVLGWWAAGALPGAGRGSVVIDGHVDSARHGPGAFAQLGELAPGDPVLVTGASGETRRYRVTGRRQFPKAELAADVFSQDVQERLVLITCGGAFDLQRRRYADNVVVFALPEEDSGSA